MCIYVFVKSPCVSIGIQVHQRLKIPSFMINVNHIYKWEWE